MAELDLTVKLNPGLDNKAKLSEHLSKSNNLIKGIDALATKLQIEASEGSSAAAVTTVLQSIIDKRVETGVEDLQSTAPTVGENGNWWSNGVDTGVKAQGVDGKSAYALAVEEGFEGTISEWVASLKGVDGEKGAKGDRGDAFQIVKVYTSKTEMDADFENTEIAEGQFVMIHTGSVEDEETAQLFVKGVAEYEFITDLSGAQGIRGDKGITPLLRKHEGNLEVSYDEGETYETLLALSAITGKSAYQIAVDEAGFVGTAEEWIASLQGADGIKGEDAAKFVGEVFYASKSANPNGAIRLDGSEKSRETYQVVFDMMVLDGLVIPEADWQAEFVANNGTVGYFSEGDGTTTFRLPVYNENDRNWLMNVDMYIQALSPVANHEPTLNSLIAKMESLEANFRFVTDEEVAEAIRINQ